MNTLYLPLNIIIGDEHPLYRIALKTIVTKAAKINRVFEASNGKELTDLLIKKQHTVVFANINLPLLKEEQFYKLIKDSYPETKVIVISPHNDSFTVKRMFNAGCVGFILETEGELEISEALEAVRNGRKYFGDKIPEMLLKRENGVKIESSLSLFSETELTILRAICFEKSNHEITNMVFRSPRTIEGYRRKIFRKANTKNALGLIRFALRNGIITHDEV